MTQEAMFNGVIEKYEGFLLEENKSFIKKLVEMAYKKKSLTSIKEL